jgi:hypothetical protein
MRPPQADDARSTIVVNGLTEQAPDVLTLGVDDGKTPCVHSRRRAWRRPVGIKPAANYLRAPPDPAERSVHNSRL